MKLTVGEWDQAQAKQQQVKEKRHIFTIWNIWITVDQTCIVQSVFHYFSMSPLGLFH